MKRTIFLLFFWGFVWLVQACDRSPIDPRLSAALQDNGAANVMYAKFIQETNANTRFEEYFRVYRSIATTKHELNERLKSISPTSRYWLLHQSLGVSVQADEQLMILEEGSLRQVLGAPEVMSESGAAMGSGDIQKARDIIGQYREQLTQTNAAVENARNTSKQAVDIVNKEIERLGLPYKQENPFVNKAAKPSPQQ